MNSADRRQEVRRTLQDRRKSPRGEDRRRENRRRRLINVMTLKKTLRPRYDSVLFDIDNVLVDTRRSYLDAIRWTVEIYLTEGNIPFFVRPPKRSTPILLTPQDVNRFKLLGGFNDDWDCCYGLLIYLLSRPVKKRTLLELKKTIDLKKFAAQVKKRPLGVAGIVKLLGHTSSVTIEKISRIFQEVYLGKDLFRICEKKKTLFWKKRGLIHREKLIFKRRQLIKMKLAGMRLGIATGRPRFEANFALRKFRIIDIFDAITTIDDVRKAEQQMKQSLRKPHPFSVLETAKKIGSELSYFYVGDLPDDVLAANLAKKELNIHSVAFPTYAPDPNTVLEEIQKAKPDFIIKKPSDLLKIIRV